MTEIHSVEIMRLSDNVTIKSGTPGKELMARAGRGIFAAAAWKPPVAVVCGTRSDDVIRALEEIPEEKRETVREVTLDLSDSMRRIVRCSFPQARRVIDRFHIQKLACDAV